MAVRDRTGPSIWNTLTSALLVSLLASGAHAQETPVSAVQGADHKSPVVGGPAVTVTGIVTALFGKGFFLQSATPDNDPATAEGIYVFIGNATGFPAPTVGNTVTVTGEPVEFQPFPELPIPRERQIVKCGTTDVTTIPTDDREAFLTITELASISALTIGATVNLPTPVPLFPPGSLTPIASADEPNTPFDPSHHPRDYFESVEHMRVGIADAIVVSRKEGPWHTFWVASAPSLAASELTAFGLPIEMPGHIFPEIFQVHVAPGQGSLKLTPGVKLGDLTGVMTYENGDYMVVLDSKIDPAALAAPEVPETIAAEVGEGTRIVTYNALNISAVSPEAKFAAIAAQIVGPLGAPDILALQEVQDDDGEAISGVVTASATLGKLVGAISAAGGPSYDIVALDPVLPNTDGGVPGGNIRTAFLVKQGAGITVGETERLFDNDDRCDRETNPFASSRKPLLAEVTIEGTAYVLVNMHLSSKLGDQGRYSNAGDPKADSDVGRRKQAETLVAELESRYGADRPRIILLGDFNDHFDADTLDAFRSSTLNFVFLRDSRGEPYSFSHEFHGVRAAIDHIVIGGSLDESAIGALHYMNLNADELDRASDHNPVRLILN